MHIKSIRNKYDCSTPASGTAATAVKRCSMLNVTAVNILTVGNILHPFKVHILCIKAGHNRIARKLTVTCVAEPLSVRTVRRHTAVNIIELSADICINNPLKHIVIALIVCDDLHIGMNNRKFNGICVALHLKVSACVPGKLRIELVLLEFI